MLYKPHGLKLQSSGWQQWQSLRFIDEQFVRFRQTKPIRPHPRYVWKGGLVLLTLACVGVYPTLVILPLLSLIFFASNFISGARLAGAAAATLAAEHETGTYDLLAVTPHGTTYAGWQLAAGRVRRIRAYDSMRFYSRWLPWSMYIMGVFGILGALYLTFANPYATYTTVDVVIFIITGVAAIISGVSLAYALYLDGVLSITTATMTGIVAANYLRDRATAQGVTAISFLVVQGVLYVAMNFVAGFFLLIINVLGVIWGELDAIFLDTVLYIPWIILTGIVVVIVAVVIPPATVGIVREAGLRLLYLLHVRHARNR